MTRGRLRLYVGAAAGVGATFAMLDEAHRRQGRGTDVVVGWVDAHSRLSTLEMLHRISADTPPPTFLDVDAIIARRPAVVLVDDMGRRENEHEFHWQSVEKLLDAGIDVVGTLNVQHVESLRDPVVAITQTEPDGRVPDRFLDNAEQIEMVDITPEAIRRRLAHGNVYSSESIRPKDIDLFNSDAFAQLRILMLNWLSMRLSNSSPNATDTTEKIVVAIADAATSGPVVRRASRLATRFGTSFTAVHVISPSETINIDARQERRTMVEDIGGRYVEVEGKDIAAAITAFADSEHATQIVVGSPHRGRLARLQRPSLASDIMGRITAIDLHLVPTHQSRTRWLPIDRRDGLTRSRRLMGFLLGGILLTLLTIFLVSTRDEISVTTSLSLYLLCVVAITAVGGTLPGIISAITAPFLANWFLIAPLHTLRINNRENIIELFVFVSTSVIVSAFVSMASRRTSEAEHAWREASTLAALTESGTSEPLADIVRLLATTFHFSGVSLLNIEGDTPEILTSVGEHPPEDAEHADIVSQLGNNIVLAANGPALSADDHRILHAFTRQLTRALEQKRLYNIAMDAESLAKADELRTAILRAVSHDLRSPLSSIKASVSSLRETDVEWPEDVAADFLSSIESETDRLTSIVTNLLDLSRLEAGVLRPSMRAMSIEEVLPSVIHSFDADTNRIETDLPLQTPDIDADPALLERVLANLIANALVWSPVESTVTVSLHQRFNEIQIHIIDHGPGIPPDQQNIVKQPFHRLHDTSPHGGLGLGLSIADRLVAAMNGRLELRDTPGGGLTTVVILRAYNEESR